MRNANIKYRYNNIINNLTVYRYLKTFIIMGIQLRFNCLDRHTDFIETKIIGNLINVSGEFDKRAFYLTLDKSTAIKFAKTLRTEINKIED